jgi:hypothetical protein
MPDDCRVGWGFSSDSQQSFTQPGHHSASGETAPPRIGTAAAWFSELTQRPGRIAPET